jgi:hypothetical protein
MIIRSGRNAGDASVNQNVMEFWSRNKGNTRPLGHLDYLGRWLVNPDASLVPGTVDASFYLGTRVASAIGLIVQGGASQTGDLQQFRNSAAAVLFSVTAAGLPRWTAAANVQTTVGAAGTAATLPTKPSKYLKVVGDDGITYVIPAYLAA